ncbi:basic proline-rich protein-like [Diceros bicornis minor]|uniref:basic proline-rich protein-like n=1 Tax=Diceros bicornis minor TaxID=77932 RepID=UPI0026EECD70|nr:basic proline-rich protein-like [Diceros bicornis minor]
MEERSAGSGPELLLPPPPPPPPRPRAHRPRARRRRAPHGAGPPARSPVLGGPRPRTLRSLCAARPRAPAPPARADSAPSAQAASQTPAHQEEGRGTEDGGARTRPESAPPCLMPFLPGAQGGSGGAEQGSPKPLPAWPQECNCGGRDGALSRELPAWGQKQEQRTAGPTVGSPQCAAPRQEEPQAQSAGPSEGSMVSAPRPAPAEGAGAGQGHPASGPYGATGAFKKVDEITRPLLPVSSLLAAPQQPNVPAQGLPPVVPSAASGSIAIIQNVETQIPGPPRSVEPVVSFTSPPSDSATRRSLRTTDSEYWFSHFNRDQNNSSFKKTGLFLCGKDKLGLCEVKAPAVQSQLPPGEPTAKPTSAGSRGRGGRISSPRKPVGGKERSFTPRGPGPGPGWEFGGVSKTVAALGSRRAATRRERGPARRAAPQRFPALGAATPGHLPAALGSQARPRGLPGAAGEARPDWRARSRVRGLLPGGPRRAPDPDPALGPRRASPRSAALWRESPAARGAPPCAPLAVRPCALRPRTPGPGAEGARRPDSAAPAPRPPSPREPTCPAARPLGPRPAWPGGSVVRWRPAPRRLLSGVAALPRRRNAPALRRPDRFFRAGRLPGRLVARRVVRGPGTCSARPRGGGPDSPASGPRPAPPPPAPSLGAPGVPGVRAPGLRATPAPSRLRPGRPDSLRGGGVTPAKLVPRAALAGRTGWASLTPRVLKTPPFDQKPGTQQTHWSQALVT